MTKQFNGEWNGHYDFDDAANIAEISRIDSYDVLEDASVYSNGDIIESPWGSNRVLTLTKEGGEDVCIKEITVKPGYMLSLQRHFGRSEYWEVLEGTLGVVCNGNYVELPAGQGLTIPKGAVHCMVNATRAPVTVRETQRGICREKDNVRLADMNDRPLYPLGSEEEYKSFKLYETLRRRIEEQRRSSDRDLLHASPLETQGDSSGL